MLGEQMSMGGGNTEAQENFGGGVIQDSETGKIPLGRSPSPLGVFTDQPQGEVQDSETTHMPFNRKAHRGYESGTQTPINSEDLINP